MLSFFYNMKAIEILFDHHIQNRNDRSIQKYIFKKIFVLLYLNIYYVNCFQIFQIGFLNPWKIKYPPRQIAPHEKNLYISKYRNAKSPNFKVDYFTTNPCKLIFFKFLILPPIVFIIKSDFSISSRYFIVTTIVNSFYLNRFK